MGYAAIRALFLIGAIAGTSAQYFGKDLGRLSSLHHGVKGNVFAVDSRTLYLKDFQYDGEGPAAYFYVGSSKSPNSVGAVRLRDERGGTGPLRRYRGEGIALSLPDGKTLKDFKWFSVWCDEFSVNFGDVSIPRDTQFPRPSRLTGLRGAHNVHSDPIVVVDAQTLLIPNFSYDGEAPDAKFWVGRGDKPSPQGIRIPDENGKEAPLRRYDKKTIVLTLPGELTVFDIGYFSVWCEAFTVDFGHVLLPTSQLQNVPPSLKMLGVSPQSKLNCEVLYDELAFEVRWAVAGDSIVLQLVGKLEDNDYMAFGISGDSVHSQMVGGDVAVAWVNKETLKGYVFDYFLDSKSQCAGVRGSCPDEALGAKTNSVRLLNAALVNGYSIVTYQRSLKAADGLDQNIYTNMSQPIIWALGPLNSKNEVSYHHHFNKGDRLIDFGRAPVWNCPMPEGEDGPVEQYHGQKQQQQQVQKNPDPKPEEHYQTHEIKPNPVPAPKPVPKVVPWEIPPIQCYEPADGVLYAQMGPTGGKQGYSAITGHVGWGISWYINGLLIPEINVVRGKKYTFVVEGGTDPEVPAKYHPFYITDDPVGGYFHKTAAEKQKVNIYAGVRRTRTGELIPTGVGRLCNWTPDTQGPEADEYPSFGAYQRSLTLVCDPGNPGVVHWIPDRNTPDTVYYQCFTHRHLGWKINVVDSCEVQDPEESRVVDVFEQPDQRQEESLQVESRINSNSNFLDQHKKVEKIINTNKSNYDNFSSNKAGNYGGQESIQPFSNAQKYELPVSKGQIKHVIEAVESIESQMQNEARKNLTNIAHNQYLVHENNNEQSLFEQPIVENEEYIIEHPKAPGSHFLPANYKPHTLQSVLRTNGQRPVGPIRPPNRRPTPPEIKLRRPNPPPSFHEGYNNRNNFFTPHNQNHNYVYPQKKTHPQKYPSRVQPPNYHNMHSKPNPQNKNNMSPYNQPPGHFPYKAPHKPINPSVNMMGMPPYKLNPGPVNQNQNVNKGDPEIIANQVVKSQILLPGTNDAEVQQSVQSQSYINRPEQIILGKPMENPTPLDQHMVPNKQYNIQSAPITPPPRPRYQTTTPKIENIENIPIPNSNSNQPEIQSSDFLGHQVETSSFSPAVNTGFKPDTVVIESGFKPIIREPLMDRTDGFAVEDERHGDEKQNVESFSNNLKNPQRRVDADIEDYVEAAAQHLTNTNFNSNNKVTETFEPMFMPSPEDHSLNTELNTEKTKEVFPLNHAKEDRPHPVYTPTTKPEGINLFSEKKNENEMPSDMLMDSDKISPQYLPPEVPKDHTPHNSKAEETYTTYDGKTVSAATLTSVPEVNNYDDEFFSWKLPANSEKLLKSPQLGPFRGEIPPSSDMFLEDEAMSGQNDRFKLEVSSDGKTSKNGKEQHKLIKRDEDILAELRKLVESDDDDDISDSDYEEEEGKRRKREVQTTQYEENYESTTSTTQQSFTNGHMHHTEYESTNRSTLRTSQLYLVLLVLGIRYI